LVRDLGQRVQPRAGAAGQDHALQARLHPSGCYELGRRKTERIRPQKVSFVSGSMIAVVGGSAYSSSCSTCSGVSDRRTAPSVISATRSAGTYRGFPRVLVETASPSKMSALLSPTVSFTVPTSLPSVASTFQPCSISNQDTGSATTLEFALSSRREPRCATKGECGQARLHSSPPRASGEGRSAREARPGLA